MNKIKAGAILAILAVVGVFVNFSHNFSVSARGDQLLEKIKDYRSWTKITKVPIKVGANAAPMG